MREFMYAFQMSNKISFEVRYSTIGSNSSPDFATSANELNRNNTDYNRGGQAQRDLLPNKSAARDFFEKWDCCHLRKLTDEKLEELKADIEVLKEKYNYIEKHADNFGRGKYSGVPHFTFSEIIALCKQTSKSVIRKRQKEREKFQFRVLDKRKVGRTNEYMVENLKTGEKGVVNSDWLREQVLKGIVTNMGISNSGSLYTIKDKLEALQAKE